MEIAGKSTSRICMGCRGKIAGNYQQVGAPVRWREVIRHPRGGPLGAAGQQQVQGPGISDFREYSLENCFRLCIK